MIELPEATVLAEQLDKELTGRRVVAARAGSTPHKFAWYSGDPHAYADRLAACQVVGARSYGGYVEVMTDGPELVLGEGAPPRLFLPGAPDPAKHQLLVTFDDGARLAVTVTMYGWIGLVDAGDEPDRYRAAALAAPSPLSAAFDERHWEGLLAGNERLNVKALLATQQRIPGLGNGVLQDVVWAAGLHPRRKVGSLSDDELSTLFGTVRSVLGQMALLGGRSTEKDLYGDPGGYLVVMQRAALDRPCPRCGGAVTKQALLGGAVYVCEGCQR